MYVFSCKILVLYMFCLSPYPLVYSMMHWLGSLQIHDFYSTRQRLALVQEQCQPSEYSITEEAETKTDRDVIIEGADVVTLEASEETLRESGVVDEEKREGIESPEGRQGLSGIIDSDERPNTVDNSNRS